MYKPARASSLAISMLVFARIPLPALVELFVRVLIIIEILLFLFIHT